MKTNHPHLVVSLSDPFSMSFLVMTSLLFAILFTVYAAAQEVTTWGSEKTPNAPLTNLTKIAAGAYSSFALKSDGSVVSWGYNDSGQATPPSL